MRLTTKKKLFGASVEYGLSLGVFLPNLQVDLFSKSLLLVPVHLEVHWCLVTTDVVRKKICLFDSQRNALHKVAQVNATLPLPRAGTMRWTPRIYLLPAEHPQVLGGRSEREATRVFRQWLDRVLR